MATTSHNRKRPICEQTTWCGTRSRDKPLYQTIFYKNLYEKTLFFLDFYVYIFCRVRFLDIGILEG